MIRVNLLCLSLGLLATPAFAEMGQLHLEPAMQGTMDSAAPQNQTPAQFDKVKSRVLANMSSHIQIMQKTTGCIQAAKGPEDLRKCMETQRSAMEAMLPTPKPVAAPGGHRQGWGESRR